MDWHVFSDHHWKTEVDGSRLDYWPTKRKWQFRGEVQTGDVEQFIKSFERKAPSADEQEVEAQSWWSMCQVGGDLRIYVVHPNRSPEEAADDVIHQLERAIEHYQKKQRAAA